jgi:galactokinase
MKAHVLAEALIARGLDSSEFLAKQSLYSAVIERYAMLHPGSPAHAWWVPGRLEVFGKHTDYAGGRSLVCSVPRGFAVVASPRTDRTVHVVDAFRGEDATLRPSDPEPTYTGWRHYAAVVARRLARNFRGAELGADIVIASDLPRASGMSSSSALVIAVATALGHIAKLPSRPEWKNNIRHPLAAAGYYACIENGRSFGALDGDAGVGTHGGSEDHAAIVEGRPGHVSAFAFVPARALGAAPVPAEWRFVLAPCGVTANKTGTARGPYNRLSAEAAELLDKWNQSGPRAVSLGAALQSGPQAAERLRAVAGPLLKRLEHFIREDARVTAALAAIASADADALGRMSEESQADAEKLLGNQIKETSALARAASKAGAFAACSFGAGFGGSVWALVEAERAAKFAHAWHPTAFVITPGPPLTQL